MEQNRSAAPEGWYPDPGSSAKPRWWDGEAWAETEWEERTDTTPSSAPLRPAPHRPAGPPLWAPYYRAPFGAATRRFYTKYTNFSGRASRSEYWWSVAGFALVFVLYKFIESVGDAEAAGLGPAPFALLAMLFRITWVVAALLPSLALTVRRLHDANLSGWFAFLVLIPIIGWMALIVLALLPPDPGGRSYDLPNYT